MSEKKDDLKPKQRYFVELVAKGKTYTEAYKDVVMKYYPHKGNLKHSSYGIAGSRWGKQLRQYIRDYKEKEYYEDKEKSFQIMEKILEKQKAEEKEALEQEYIINDFALVASDSILVNDLGLTGLLKMLFHSVKAKKIPGKRAILLDGEPNEKRWLNEPHLVRMFEKVIITKEKFEVAVEMKKLSPTVANQINVNVNK